VGKKRRLNIVKKINKNIKRRMEEENGR